MVVELDGLIFETVEGTWSTEYIGEPSGLYDSDRVHYNIRFKLIVPNEPENIGTNERCLRLVTYHSQSAYSDYEEKLIKAIRLWLYSTEVVEVEATYVYPAITLQSPIK